VVHLGHDAPVAHLGHVDVPVGLGGGEQRLAHALHGVSVHGEVGWLLATHEQVGL
jgi:hypothetical protein